MSLRQDIRAITDALPEDTWLRYAPIYAALPEPKQPRENVTVELRKMFVDDVLIRRGKPHQYEYRSGPQPVLDKRTLKKGKKSGNRSTLGFMALAQLEREDPAAYARAIAEDKPLSGT